VYCSTAEVYCVLCTVYCSTGEVYCTQVQTSRGGGGKAEHSLCIPRAFPDTPPCEIRRLPLDRHCNSGVNSQYRRGMVVFVAFPGTPPCKRRHADAVCVSYRERRLQTITHLGSVAAGEGDSLLRVSHAKSQSFPLVSLKEKYSMLYTLNLTVIFERSTSHSPAVGPGARAPARDTAHSRP
jgi:hypothetical protein